MRNWEDERLRKITSQPLNLSTSGLIEMAGNPAPALFF